MCLVTTARSGHGACAIDGFRVDTAWIRWLAAAALLTMPVYAGCALQRPEVTYVATGGVLPREIPISETVKAGSFVFVSGQVGNAPGTVSLVAGGLEAETRQAISNVELVLTAHGLTLRDVVKCTVILTDMSQWSRFNSIYQQYFRPPYPARTAIGASGLALGAQVELECVAIVSHRRNSPA